MRGITSHKGNAKYAADPPITCTAPHLSHSYAIVDHCPPLEGVRGRLNTVTNSFLNIQLKQPLPVQPYSLPVPLQRGIAYYRANADTNYLHHISPIAVPLSITVPLWRDGACPPTGG